MVKTKPKFKSSGSSKGYSYTYKPRDPSDVKRRAERSSGGFDSIFKPTTNVWRPKSGDNSFRIMPPTWDAQDHFGYSIWVHNQIGPNNSTYLCAQKMKNKYCPICKAAKEAHDAGEEDEWKALRPIERFAVYVIDRSERTPQPLAYSMSFSMDREINALAYNKKTGASLWVDSPDDGYDIAFTKTGTGLQTRYVGVQIEREASPLSSSSKEQAALMQEIIENPINTALHFYPADYLENLLKGAVEDKDEDLDEDDEEEQEEAPAKTKKARADQEEREAQAFKKRSKAHEEEEEEEEEEETDEEEEQDEEEQDEEAEEEAADDEEAEEEDDASEDDEEEESEEEEADEDEVPPPKSRRGKIEREPLRARGRNGRAYAAEDDEEDDEPALRKRAPVRVATKTKKTARASRR